MHRQYRVVSKQRDRLKKKIAAASEVVGVSLDEEAHKDGCIHSGFSVNT